MWTLRYLPNVPLKLRKHSFTLGRWSNIIDADNALAASPVGHLLEVVKR